MDVWESLMRSQYVDSILARVSARGLGTLIVTIVHDLSGYSRNTRRHNTRVANHRKTSLTSGGPYNEKTLRSYLDASLGAWAPYCDRGQ